MSDLQARIASLSPAQRQLLLRRLAAEKDQAGQPVATGDGPTPADAVPRLPRDGRAFPLSFGEERLWFLQQFAPQEPTYHVPIVLELAGELVTRALARALAGVAARHETLRTTFPASNDGPRRVIQPAARRHLPVVDLSALGAGAEASEAAAADLARRQVARPFDLAAGPLWRAALLRAGTQRHQLAMVFHHIVFDDWSGGVLLSETAALYRAAVTGAGELPPLPLQVADHAAWQRAELAGERAVRELAYWRERLAGAPEALSLPSDRPRPAVRTYRGGLRWRKLPAESRDAVRELSRGGAATTPFMVWLATFALLIGRASGGRDVVVGTPIANRDSAQTAQLIGFFLNTLALRLEWGGQASFAELLATCRRRTLEAYDHRSLPFEKLVKELAVERSLSHSPLFQVLFIYQAMPQEGGELPGLHLSLRETTSTVAKFELTLLVRDSEQGPIAYLEFNRDLFDGTTAERLLLSYERLLLAAARAPAAAAERLGLLAASERQQLIAEWNDTFTPLDGEATLLGELAARLPARDEAIAVGRGGDSWSYAALAAQQAAVAASLGQLGVGPGDLVALAVERSPAMLWALLGILAAGAAYVPLDPAYPADRLAFMLGDSRPAAVVRSRSVTLPAAGRTPELLLDDGADRPSFAADLPQAAEPPLAAQLAYVIYTSGSTGRPKGVAITHAALYNFLASMAEAPGLAAGERWLAVTSLSFDIAGLELYLPLLAGATVVVASREQAAEGGRLAALLASSRATVMQATPAVWRLVLATGWPAGEAAIPRCLVGGEALSGDLAGELRGRALAAWNLYGPTETTIWSSRQRLVADAGAVSSLGRPLANTAIHLWDRARELVPIGIAGELMIGGDGLARGYLGRPALTAERFVPAWPGAPGGRLYRTGDLARRLPDGRLEFLGRLDSQVKLRGLRLELGEVEAALGEHPAVAEAAAVVRTVGSDPEPRLVAYWCRRAGGAAGALELREHLLGRLPAPLVPAFFVELAALPRTPNQKLDRRALPAPQLDREQLASGGFVAPRNPLEATLAAVWAKVLRLPSVGVHDNFFTLGGDSILSLQIVARLSPLGQVLEPRHVFERPTIAGLAALLAAASPPAAAPAAAESEGTGQPAPGEDFPLATVDAATRARLVAQHGEIADLYPLGPSQQGILLYSLLAPGSEAYFQQLSCTFAGDLDPAAFRTAWERLVARHSVLRTALAWEGGERPLQVVVPRVALPWQELDWRALSPGEQTARLPELFAADRRRGLDLAAAPLFRLTLVHLGDGRCHFLWSYHHTLLDGWSVPVLLGELSTCYDAACRGREPELPPATPYRDYIAWWLAQDQGAAEAYWRHRLAGFTTPTGLPFDRRPEVSLAGFGATRGASARLSEVETSRLRDFARRHQLTLNTLVQGAWGLLLGRLAQRRDVLFGAVSSGRPPSLPGVETMIGLFIATLPVRLSLDVGAPVVSWLAALQGDRLADHRFEHAPLAEIQSWSELAGRQSLFSSLLVFENYPFEATAAEWSRRVSLADGQVFERTSYPLTVFVWPGRELLFGVSFELEHFEDSTIRRLVGQLTGLLNALATADGSRLGELPWLAAGERHQLLNEWNDAALPAFGPAHLELAARANSTPDAIAAVAADELLSYQGLLAASRHLGGRLRRAGAEPDRPIPLLAPRGLDFLVAVFGAWWAGAAYLPLDTESPAARLGELIATSGARLALVSHCQREAMAGALATLGPACQPRCLELADEPAAIAAGPEPELRVLGTADQLAYVIFTSGSTGRPKGAMLTHRGMSNHLTAKVQDLALSASDRVAQTASQCFDISVWQFVAPLLVGGRVVIFPTAVATDPHRLLAGIAAERVTIVETVPALLLLLLEEIAATGTGPATCRWMIPTGEALPPELARRWLAAFPATPLLNAYGPTECSDDVSHEVIDRSPAAAVVNCPIGRPVANARLHVVLPGFYLAPIATPGELCVGGPAVGRGYLGQPARTAETFVPDPWSPQPGGRLYRTGDRVTLLADGRLELQGRLDHQIKVRGFRVEPEEIEACLRRHPAVRDAAVRAFRDGSGATYLVAYLEDGAGADETSLRTHLAAALPPYMTPSAFVHLAALPRNVNGKLDRRALLAPAAGATARHEVFAPPQGPLESALAAIWQALLHVEAVGRRDDFFALGGHSMLALRAISLLRAQGFSLSLRDFAEAPGLAELARRATLLDPRRREAKPAFGPTPFSPGQHYYFGMQQLTPSERHIVQLLAPQERLEPRWVAATLAALLAHHDALRAHFVCDPTGWRQVIAEQVPTPFSLVDLSGLSPRHAKRVIAGGRGITRALKIEEGPLLRFALLRRGRGEPDALLVVGHHLGLDELSLQLLFEDVATAYGQLQAGRERIELPPVGTPFKQWAERLAAYARSEEILSELTYWRSPERRALTAPPVDLAAAMADPLAHNTAASAAGVVARIRREASQALFHDIPRRCSVTIDAIGLYGLREAFSGWATDAYLKVDLVQHGRNPPDPEIDLSRTVGWLSMGFPAIVPLGEPFASPLEGVAAVQAELDRVPSKGLGFSLLYLRGDPEISDSLTNLPRAEVMLNIILDGELRAAAGSAPAATPPASPLADRAAVSLADEASEASAPALRPHFFRITLRLVRGEITAYWEYSRNLHRRRTARRLARRFEEALEGLARAHAKNEHEALAPPSAQPHAGRSPIDRRH